MINSNLMSIRLLLKKQQKVIDVANRLLSEKSLTAKELATFVNMCEAAPPAIEFGRLFLGYMQQEKHETFQYGKSNHDFQCDLTPRKRFFGGNYFRIQQYKGLSRN